MMNGNRAIDMGGTVLTFKLNGDAELQIPEIAAAELPDLPDTDFTLEQVREGDTLYHAQCSSCHGGIGIADEVAIVAPDLRLMSLDSHSQMETIVLQGSRVQQGMPDFENTINKDELAAKAIEVMNRKKITSLCVHGNKNKKKTIGIIHVHDLISAGVL